MEMLRASKKLTNFIEEKSPTKDKDFCFRTFRKKDADFRYCYYKEIYGMELIAFIESINDEQFENRSKQAMLRDLFEALKPHQKLDSMYSGCTGLDKAIEPIASLIKNHFKPDTRMNYSSAQTGTAESGIYFKGKRVSDARTYTIYYEFIVNVTIEEMIDYMIDGSDK